MNDLLKGKRIFVIEDDVADMSVLAMGLQHSGAFVVREYYSQGIVDHLAEYLPIDLILLDLNLRGGVSGYDVSDKIRARPRMQTIPIVIMTAMDPETEIPRAQAKSMNGFISKPVNLQKLPEHIARIINGEKIWLISR